MIKNIDDNELKLKKTTLVGLLLNFFLAAIKLIAGYYGKSQAVVADGVHSLSDSATDIALIVGSSYWSAPPDREHPYGHRRIETLITVFIGLLLFFLAFEIGKNALKTFFDEDETPQFFAFAAAFVSIIVKELLYRWNAKVGKEIRSSAMIANAWHHRSDAISSIPASLAVIFSMILPTYNFIDNVGAIVVCFFIFYAATKICRPAIMELIDAGANQAVCNLIEETALDVEGVKSVHKCRTRLLGSWIQVDLHVQVDPEINVREGHEISSRVKARLIEKKPDILDVVVHLEPFEK